MTHKHVTMFNANTALWHTRDAAEMIAERNQHDDPDWIYRVETTYTGLHFVAVYDEAGNFVGTL